MITYLLWHNNAILETIVKIQLIIKLIVCIYLHRNKVKLNLMHRRQQGTIFPTVNSKLKNNQARKKYKIIKLVIYK